MHISTKNHSCSTYIYDDKRHKLHSLSLSLSCELRICQLAHENIAEGESHFHKKTPKRMPKRGRRQRETNSETKSEKNHMTSSAEARVISFFETNSVPSLLTSILKKENPHPHSSHYVSTLESKVTRLYISRFRNRKLCEKLTGYAEGKSSSHEVIAARCPPCSVSITVKRTTSLDSQLRAAQATQA